MGIGGRSSMSEAEHALLHLPVHSCYWDTTPPPPDWRSSDQLSKIANGRLCRRCNQPGHLQYGCPLNKRPDGVPTPSTETRTEKRRNRRHNRNAKRRSERQELFAEMTKEERAAYYTQKKAQQDDQAEAQARAVELAAECGMRVVIELGYTESMNQKELRSVCSQCANAYSTMRRSPAPCALHLTSCEGFLAEGLLAAGLGNWTGVYQHTEAVPQAFSGADGPIVMLSPDAEEPLLELDPAAVYVIGGIVDTSVRAGESLGRASEWKVPAVRLPIAEFAPEFRCRVLNIDTVFGLLQSVSVHGDWRRALVEGIPKRLQKQ